MIFLMLCLIIVSTFLQPNNANHHESDLAITRCMIAVNTVFSVEVLLHTLALTAQETELIRTRRKLMIQVLMLFVDDQAQTRMLTTPMQTNLSEHTCGPALILPTPGTLTTTSTQSGWHRSPATCSQEPALLAGAVIWT